MSDNLAGYGFIEELYLLRSNYKYNSQNDKAINRTSRTYYISNRKE